MKRVVIATAVALMCAGVISTAQKPGNPNPGRVHGNPFLQWDDNGEVVHMLPPHGVAHGKDAGDDTAVDDDGEIFAPSTNTFASTTGSAGATYTASYGSGALTDKGGLEISNAAYFAIYWNSSVSGSTAVSKTTATVYKTLQAELSDFITKFGADANFTNVASNNLSIIQQYGSKSAIAPTLTNLGYFIDTQKTAASITDASIRTYLTGLFNAGKVKVSANTIYGVYFPAGMTVNLMTGYNSCAQFCAYHRAFTYSTAAGSVQIKYAVMPYTNCTACTISGLQVADTLTITTGHEIREAITNPGDNGLVSWTDLNGYEADDKCAWHNLYQMSNGKFWMQPEYSNGGTKNAATGVTYPGPGCIVPK